MNRAVDIFSLVSVEDKYEMQGILIKEARSKSAEHLHKLFRTKISGKLKGILHTQTGKATHKMIAVFSKIIDMHLELDSIGKNMTAKDLMKKYRFISTDTLYETGLLEESLRKLI